MRVLRSIWVLALFGVMFACDTDPIRAVLPSIAVSACKSPAIELEGSWLGGTKDCELALGEVEISSEVFKEVTVSNPSAVPLRLTGIALMRGGESPYQVNSEVKKLLPGEKFQIKVRARPLREQNLEDVLLITSDAGNLGDAKYVEVALRGQTVNRGMPEIEIVPTTCDFGKVGIGQVSKCIVTVKNHGQKKLVLDQIENDTARFLRPQTSNEQAFSFFGRPPLPKQAIEPGGELAIAFRFNPQAKGEYALPYMVDSNDPDEHKQEILLKGAGAVAPVAQCRLKSVNGDRTATLQGIGPLDQVILTGEGSHALEEGGTIGGYRWEIIQNPAGSNARLSAPSGLDTGFVFADNKPGIDLAGKYKVNLWVTDSFGTSSATPCTIAFDAVPQDDFHIQLVWDTSYGDMDLHVAKQNADRRFCVSHLNGTGHPGPLGQTCSDGSLYQECNYGTCRTNGSTDRSGAPQWDENRATREGDPTLDIDDLTGYGPENINIDHPTTGSYLVSVHNYGGGRPSGNTVRIYLFGQLMGEFFKILEPSAWWEVAVIRWPENMSGHPCVEDLATSRIECPNS